MALRPGWKIWAGTLSDMLDSRFAKYARGEQTRRVNRFLSELELRQDEVMPAGQNAKLIDQVIKAIGVASGNMPEAAIAMWPDAATAYVINHGGEEALQAALDANELLLRLPCPEGSGCQGDVHILACPDKRTREAFGQMLEQGSRHGLSSILLGGLFGGGMPFDPDLDEEDLTPLGRELRGMERGGFFGYADAARRNQDDSRRRRREGQESPDNSEHDLGRARETAGVGA